mmetsp:Transcript_13802/g.25745  ORF Transcript_13802/g.25745 Transcript_13802/m.25745 type:complete len:232 (+) Transcript_13802:686-1381(+)
MTKTNVYMHKSCRLLTHTNNEVPVMSQIGGPCNADHRFELQSTSFHHHPLLPFHARVEDDIATATLSAAPPTLPRRPASRLTVGGGRRRRRRPPGHGRRGRPAAAQEPVRLGLELHLPVPAAPARRPLAGEVLRRPRPRRPRARGAAYGAGAGRRAGAAHRAPVHARPTRYLPGGGGRGGRRAEHRALRERAVHELADGPLEAAAAARGPQRPAHRLAGRVPVHGGAADGL